MVSFPVENVTIRRDPYIDRVVTNGRKIRLTQAITPKKSTEPVGYREIKTSVHITRPS